MNFTENFKIFLDNIPQGIFPPKADPPGAGEKEEVKFKDRAEMLGFAKMAYPQIYAYMKIFNGCCRKKEELGIHNDIKDEGVRARFDKFVRGGGDIEKLKQGKVEEEFLSREDLELFKKAESEMHKEVAKETREEIKGSKKAEFLEFVKEGEEKLRKVEEKIKLLREMAAKSPEFGNEILEKVDELEERWANSGNEPQEQDVVELLEYYNSVMEVES